MSDGALFDPTVGTVPPPTLTVGELTTQVARVLASAFPGDVWVEGQIRNLSRAANDHVYFQLVEPTAAGQAPQHQLAVTLLRPERAHVNRKLKNAGGAVRMADGIEVRIRGRVRWYAPRGTVQLRMDDIDPAFTLGRLEADRERILAALAAEDLLDANAARPLALVPLRVGLVTSQGSAAHADVLAELRSSGYAFEVHEADARTQGDGAAASVVRALAVLAARDDLDVVLVVRGGGARTDLAAFDTEAIARAIAAMAVPVFTGIGHEVDRSIADEVAHTAHKTPTAAAGTLVRAVTAFLERIDQQAAAVARAGRAAAGVATDRLDRRATRVARAATGTLVRQEVRVDDLARRVGRGSRRTVERADARLEGAAASVGERADRAIVRATRDLDGLAARVRAQDPVHALARGWSITSTAQGDLVRDLAALAPGTVLSTRVAAGTVTSTVTAVDPVPPPSEEPSP